MPLRTVAPWVALLLAAGCGHKEEEAPARTGTAAVTIGRGASGKDQSLAIDVPGFSARLDVPGLALGAGAFALDGVALAPGTNITGMKIAGAAGDGSGGDGAAAVEAAFTSPQSPADVLAYYRRAAPAGGWTVVPPAAGQQFAATRATARGAERLAIAVAPQGTGSAGRFMVSGG